ncbi:signal recognition particle receptor subunit alpha-like [Hylaeus volcanicus]|uniref:signal recognition particle receptor subunit alpha-like n=1 Tax=Hylaeus volcanicus TaxID=313075 RepID=UPI0023B883D8|nr:signal recognition particle receptor subunit alpha-like [Hylaeus volcanicus]
MIDSIYVFTKGGVILWSKNITKNFSATSLTIVNNLIQSVFLQEKFSTQGAYATYTINDFSVSCELLNSIQSVMICITSGTLERIFVHRFLEYFSKQFLENVSAVYSKQLNTAAVTSRGDAAETALQTGLWCLLKSEPLNSTLHYNVNHILNHLGAIIDLKPKNISSSEPNRGKKKDEENTILEEKCLAHDMKRKKKPTFCGPQKVTKKAMLHLDFSNKPEETNGNAKNAESNEIQAVSSSFLDSSSSDDQSETKSYFTTKFFSQMKDSIQQSFTGNKVLTKNDLTILLEEMKTKFLSRNVAADMVSQLIGSVEESLIETKTNSFQSVKTAVYDVFHATLERILSQQCIRDVLKEIAVAKEKGHVYSICFLGVNGVGKSTSLAKVAYYLKRKGNLKVMLAACDTFRAGAVEQLKTHTKNLGIHLFEQGYGKDAALLCSAALKYAQTNAYDVVLIDTAGRMQDNEPLMRSLSKLVAFNTPDLVLFVGEALAGNDSIHQLTKFNQCLIDYAPTNIQHPRGVDAIFLTKFDTVGTKVGTVLSLAYVSSCPIAFVGTGQRYTDIQKLKVHSVVTSLLSDI